jgi:transcriptional regulator with XRE-family HTH domain
MDEKEMRKKKIGSRINLIRTKLGLTMKEFGEKFDPPASDSIVSRWERGISSPNEERLNRIAELGNISLLYLTTGNKALSDLSDDELRESLKRSKEYAKKEKKEQEHHLKEELKLVLNSELDYVETAYLLSALNYLKFSNKHDVMTLTAIITNLNRYHEAGKYDDVKQEELLTFIESEAESIKEFLKQRYHYNKEGE